MSNLTISRGIGIKYKDLFLVPPNYDSIKPAIVDGKASDNIFLTAVDGKVGCIVVYYGKQSYRKIDPIYDSVGEFKNGIAIARTSPVTHKPLFELINTNLDMVLDEELFDNITRVDNGYFIVEKDGFYGVLNSKGIEVVACKFSSIEFDKNTKKFSLDVNPPDSMMGGLVE